MWRHAKIGNKKMFYVLLPGIPKVKVTKTGKHVIGYRDRSFHHLYGVGNTDVDTRAPTTGRKKLYIAFHHYHEVVYWQILRDSSKLSKKIHKWRVPIDVGRQCDPPLTNADKCKVPDTRRGYGDAFFAVPILSDLDSAYTKIAEAEREYNLRLNAYDLNVGEPVLVTGRKTPKERRIDMKERDAKANPRAAALRMQDLEVEIEMLRVEVKKLKEAADESDKTHQAELEMQNEIVTAQLMSTGLTRLSMLSNTYHKDKPWLSKYLFGRTWEQHLDLAKELFRVTPTAIRMTDAITDFEKFSICAMIARRGYTQHTAAAIYDISRGRISEYMKQWMPRLVQKGSYCSELDLVMSHNLFSIEYCKENGLPYMEDGVAHNL